MGIITKIRTPQIFQMRIMAILLRGTRQKRTSTTTRGVLLPTARRTTVWRTGFRREVGLGNINLMQVVVGLEKKKTLLVSGLESIVKGNPLHNLRWLPS